MRVEDYSTCPVCLLAHLASNERYQRLQHGKCSKIKKPFSLKLPSSKVRGVIAKLTATKSGIEREIPSLHILQRRV